MRNCVNAIRGSLCVAASTGHAPLLDVLREEALVEVVADRVVDEGPALLLRRAARLVAEDDVVVPAPLDSAGRRLRANQQ